MNPYSSDAAYSCPGFRLRPVTLDDAEDLLLCYSDPAAVARMNADNCTSDFYFDTAEKMRAYISFWIKDAADMNYVRFAIIPDKGDRAVGTVEMFGSNDRPEMGRWGLLRLDLASAYETDEHIEALTRLAMGPMMDDFSVDTLLIKAEHTPDRLRVFRALGFSPCPSFRPGQGYFAYARPGH